MKDKKHLLNNIQQANEKPPKQDRFYLTIIAILVVVGLVIILSLAS